MIGSVFSTVVYIQSWEKMLVQRNDFKFWDSCALMIQPSINENLTINWSMPIFVSSAQIQHKISNLRKQEIFKSGSFRARISAKGEFFGT